MMTTKCYGCGTVGETRFIIQQEEAEDINLCINCFMNANGIMFREIKEPSDMLKVAKEMVGDYD